MKMKKLACLFALFAVLMTSALAQVATPTPKPVGINGTLEIDYRTRTDLDETGNIKPGIKDVYKYDLNIAELYNFSGSIATMPTLFSSTLGREIQGAQNVFDLNLGVRNPADLTKMRPIGKMVGTVPIDKFGIYQFDQGNLRLAINAAGTAKAMESHFRGRAAGKPPKNESSLQKAQKQAQTIKRQYQGKLMAIKLVDYDKMAFNNLILPAGPLPTKYPATTVNGEMIYDYDRSVWFFNNVTTSYVGEDGKTVVDRISGTIQWIEDPKREVNGKGQYEFDVRINEPETPAGEASFFQSGDDESSFFAIDNTLAALTGTAVYQDNLKDGATVKSSVKIEMVGNKLTKVQVFNLAKILWFVEVVPMNSD